MKAEGWVNLDKYASFDPDVVHDLEAIRWPFDDNSRSDISVIHLLEHLGQDSIRSIAIVQELYRIAKPDAQIQINL
jgi:predicted SAM-dependent methyltransferase